MEKKIKMIFFSLVLVLISEVVRGGFVLDAAKCEQLMAIPPPDPLLEEEHCSVCEQIVHNSRSWNWAQHYESLCVNIPPHAMSWVCFFSFFLSTNDNTFTRHIIHSVCITFANSLNASTLRRRRARL